MDKKLIAIILTTICLMAAFLFGYNLDKKKQIQIVKLDRSFKLYDEKKDIEYNIESIKLSNGIGNISGWAAVDGVDSNDVRPLIILRDENNNMYKIKTRITKRKDVTQLLNDIRKNQNRDQSRKNVVYDNSGITSEFNISDLKKNKKYQIGVQVQIKNTRYFVWTDKELLL